MLGRLTGRTVLPEALLIWPKCCLPAGRILQGGWDAEGIYQPGWFPYADYFQRMAKIISGCDEKGGKGHKVIMGPGWDNVSHSERV